MQHRTGRIGEQIAKEYLLSKGMICAEENYRAQGGEIDLIMLDGARCVFVEVKTRAYGRDAGAFEAVTPAKRSRISQTALRYLRERGIRGASCRFDVVVVLGQPPDAAVKHYPNAFAFSAKGYFV